MENFDFLDFFWNVTFLSKKHSFLSTILKKQSFVASFAQKIHMVKSSSFWQKPWSNPLKTFDFLEFWKLHFSGLKSILVSPGYYETLYSGLICQKTYMLKSSIFSHKLKTNPFGKSRFFGLFCNITFLVKKRSLSRILKNDLFWLDLPTKKNTW